MPDGVDAGVYWMQQSRADPAANRARVKAQSEQLATCNDAVLAIRHLGDVLPMRARFGPDVGLELARIAHGTNHGGHRMSDWNSRASLMGRTMAANDASRCPDCA